jgi:hypothetical protein
LLAYHRAHRNFEGFPGTGNSEAWKSRDPRRELRVTGQMLVYRRAVGIQVKKISHLGLDRGALCRCDSRQCNSQSMRLRRGLDGNGTETASQGVYAPVNLAFHHFHAGDGAPLQELEEVWPIQRR